MPRGRAERRARLRHQGPAEIVAEVVPAAAATIVDKHLGGKLQAKAIEVLLSLGQAGVAAQVQSALAKARHELSGEASAKDAPGIILVCGSLSIFKSCMRKDVT